MTNIVLSQKLLRPALILSWVGFALCLLIVPSLFLGSPEFLFSLLFGIIFLGIFPLWFGAISVLLPRRRNNAQAFGPKIWFRGLPGWFPILYQTYFYIVILGFLAGFIQAFRGKPSWVALGFVFIPSVFYLGSAGIYWSELMEKRTNASGVPPLLVPPMLPRKRLKIGSLFKKHWLRMVPLWLSPVFFVTFVNLNPAVKLDDITAILFLIAALLSFAGLPFMARSMKDNDYPLLEKTLLLIAFPFWASTLLTHLVCMLVL